MKISGTRAIFGPYIILMPITLFALFCSSQHVVVGGNFTAAATLAPTLAKMVLQGLAEWLPSESSLGFVSAGCPSLARVIHLGFLAGIPLRTVLVGVLTGIVVQVPLGEISGMFRFARGGLGPPTIRVGVPTPTTLLR
jgi:SulP family sulfate permease